MCSRRLVAVGLFTIGLLGPAPADLALDPNIETAHQGIAQVKAEYSYKTILSLILTSTLAI
jgi:hypothetical protein